MPGSDVKRLRIGVLACMIALASCSPKDAPLQSDVKPLGFGVYAPVKASGSDFRSWYFERWTLPILITLANKEYTAAAVADHFEKLKIDPAKLKLAEDTDVRVYFIGEGSGYRDGLGINLEGIGLTEGRPLIIFPNANTNVQLDACAGLINPKRMKLDRSKLDQRSQLNPLLPGDFVELGKLPAGTFLNFFLIADEGNPDAARTYTAIPDRNPDRIAHMVAIAVEKTSWLLLSFEDMFQGGDKDYEDCVFAVELSAGNIEALIGKIDPWRRIRQLIVLAAIVVVAVGTPSTYLVLKRRAKKRRLERARRHVEALLASDHPEDALKIIDAVYKENPDKRWRNVWRGLEMDVFEKTKDVEGLRELFGQSTRLFGERESVAFAVARAEVDDERYDSAATLRNAWRGRERKPEDWLALEVDMLVKQEKEFTALDVLASSRFKAEADCVRLARLAFLKSNEDMQRAGVMLADAVALNPHNPDVHVFRGKYLEKQEKWKEAVKAYRTAFSCAPKDPRMADRLADALCRNGEHEEALRIWRDALNPPSMAFVWLKTLFWTRVSTAIPVAWDGRALPRGHLRPLIEFMLQIEKARFWDARAFAPIAERQPDLPSRQEVFWLRVLEALRSHSDGEALTLLNLQGFGARSWHPPLENALLRIVIYRLRGFLGTPLNQNVDIAAFPKPDHPFFAELDDWTKHAGITVPDAAKRFLESDYVFAAACLAAGWWEAGIKLFRESALPHDAPAWVHRDMEEAYSRHARSKSKG